MLTLLSALLSLFCVHVLLIDFAFARAVFILMLLVLFLTILPSLGPLIPVTIQRTLMGTLHRFAHFFFFFPPSHSLRSDIFTNEAV